MTIYYDRMAATATRLLATYGRPQGVTLVKSGPSFYDPSIGKNSPTTQTYVGTGVLLDFSMTQPGVSTVRGTTVEQGDKILYMSMSGTLNGAAAQIPEIGTADTIYVDGAAYSVEAATVWNPGGTSVMQEAHVRGVPTGG